MALLLLYAVVLSQKIFQLTKNKIHLSLKGYYGTMKIRLP